MPNNLVKRVEELTEKIRKQQAHTPSNKQPEKNNESSKKKVATKKKVLANVRQPGKSGASAVREAERELTRIAASLGIEQFDLFPGGEYPTPFARLPLFPPIQRKRAQQKLAESVLKSDWVVLESRWNGGGVWKSGPALTVYDEDTLTGLMKLRSVGLAGPPQSMPLPTPKITSMTTKGNKGDRVVVHSLYCLVSQLESFIQKKTPAKGWGGRAIHKRRESIERLGAIKLKFQKTKNRDEYRGKQIDLIYLDWVGDKNEAVYYVQFHPLVSAWLEEYRTFIDMDLRRELSPLGKAMHRFLASQRSNRFYSEDLLTILGAIGAEGTIGNLKRQLSPQFEIMKSHGLFLAAEITGTGRKTPYKLEVQFKE